MNEITFSVAGNKITLTGSVMPVSGSLGYDKCKFTFDSEWTGFSKTAIFSMGSGEEYSSPIIGEYCNIPEEALRKSGILKVGAVGVNNAGTLISTNQAAVRIRRGANETETIPFTVAASLRESGGGAG